jgi:glycosyltransferase involved in cell wall biosynthesis
MTEEKVRKKILFFGTLPPPVTGAGLRNKSLMESALINAAYQIELIPFNFAEEVDDIGKFSFRKIFKAIQRGGTILYKVVSYRPHLVYFNVSLYGFALYRDFIYVILFKVLRCRLLYHLRTQGVKSQVQRSRLKRLMFRLIFRNTRVICLSEFLSRDIADVYSAKPFVVNNGIKDISQRYPVKKKPAGEAPWVLFLAHLWLFKGVMELIEAFHILKTEGVRFHAIIAGPEGDVSIAQLKEKAASLGLSAEIDVPGPKDGDEKNQLFRDADIFVLPTTFEGLPGAVLEAMQFGLPVVATCEGAIPEIVDDGRTGLLVKKRDPVDLAAKLKRVLTDEPYRNSLGKNGRSKFVNCYTLEHFERNMLAVFDQVIGKR